MEILRANGHFPSPEGQTVLSIKGRLDEFIDRAISYATDRKPFSQELDVFEEFVKNYEGTEGQLFLGGVQIPIIFFPNDCGFRARFLGETKECLLDYYSPKQIGHFILRPRVESTLAK